MEKSGDGNAFSEKNGPSQAGAVEHRRFMGAMGYYPRKHGLPLQPMSFASTLKPNLQFPRRSTEKMRYFHGLTRVRAIRSILIL
jgi:hypothetical protein